MHYSVIVVKLKLLLSLLFLLRIGAIIVFDFRFCHLQQHQGISQLKLLPNIRTMCDDGLQIKTKKLISYEVQAVCIDY